jgi:hypothetical protein
MQRVPTIIEHGRANSTDRIRSPTHKREHLASHFGPVQNASIPRYSLMTSHEIGHLTIHFG